MANDGPCETKERRIHLKSNNRRQFDDNLIASLLSNSNRTDVYLLGYDVFRLKFKCYNGTKLLTSKQADSDLDAIFDPLSLSINQEEEQLILKDDMVPEPLLNPCRPGSRFGNNFKCTNPISPSSSSKERNDEYRNNNAKIAHNSPWICLGSQFLQASGQCVSSITGNRRSVSCGASYTYDETSDQCRQTFYDFPGYHQL